jgi:hypothetical protein
MVFVTIYLKCDKNRLVLGTIKCFKILSEAKTHYRLKNTTDKLPHGRFRYILVPIFVAQDDYKIVLKSLHPSGSKDTGNML